MNILVVNPFSHDPRLNSFVFTPAAEYQRRGHAVRVLTLSAFGKKTPGWDKKYSLSLTRQTVGGLDHFRLQRPSFSNAGNRLGVNAFFLDRALKRHLPAVLEGFRPDIIHAHTLNTGERMYRLKTELGCPLVVTTHGTDTSALFQAGDYESLRRKAGAADMVGAVCSALEKKLLTAGVQTEIRVINNGAVHPAPDEGIPKQPLSLMQAGRLIPQKKVDVTIRAFAALRKTYPEATLLIAGSGPEMEPWKALCRELGVEDAVRMPGQLPHPELLREMSRAQFFMMPSVREGFAQVYPEAMSRSCITIGTEGEGVTDLIVSGKNGFLVPPDDPDAIVRDVEFCLQHPQEAAAIAEQGRQDAMNLTWERNAAQYLELFDEILRKRSGK